MNNKDMPAPLAVVGYHAVGFNDNRQVAANTMTFTKEEAADFVKKLILDGGYETVGVYPLIQVSNAALDELERRNEAQN